MSLLDEKLVWMTDDDFKCLIHAANVNSNFLMQSDDLLAQIRDLDGDLIGPELIAQWEDTNEKAHRAISRAKYVPDVTLHKLFLIIQSD